MLSQEYHEIFAPGDQVDFRKDHPLTEEVRTWIGEGPFYVNRVVPNLDETTRPEADHHQYLFLVKVGEGGQELMHNSVTKRWEHWRDEKVYFGHPSYFSGAFFRRLAA